MRIQEKWRDLLKKKLFTECILGWFRKEAAIKGSKEDKWQADNTIFISG